MSMQLAMYRGPAQDLAHKLAHWGVCVFTMSRYSHCELVIDGVCYTSSARDGGVRSKVIDLESGRWTVFDLPDDPQRQARALEWFRDHDGQGYDWAGAGRFLIPALPQWPRQWFCSEAIAAALGIDFAEELDPQDLLDALVDAF